MIRQPEPGHIVGAAECSSNHRRTVSSTTEARTATFAELFESIARNVESVIRGKPETVRLVLLCLLSEGHLLLEDAPGVGKTSIAKAVGRSIDVEVGRIQFTPDLLPSDVIGVAVWDRGTSQFDFRKGPVFNSIVVADEINRASPKTQSALLEAMAERQVTVDRTTHVLPHPFLVIATQNPLEHEGTYPLPESQLDRFMMRVSVGYPSRAAELEILNGQQGGSRLEELEPVVTAAEIRGMVRSVLNVHVAPTVKGYLVDLAAASRSHPGMSLGVSPRATLSLQRVSQARAAALGRDFVTPDDVKALARHCLGHRVVASPQAVSRGMSGAEVLVELVASLPVPVVT
jgi:MoxR-like ATPase